MNGMVKRRPEVLLFEYLLFLGEYRLKKGGSSFWHSYATIHERTGLSSGTARSIVKKLESEGFLQTRLTHQRGSQVTEFAIRYTHFATRMASLFGGEEICHSSGQLARIANRQRALRRMARMQALLVSRRKALLRR